MPSHRLASPLVRQCPFIPVGTGLYDANDVELLRVTGGCPPMTAATPCNA